MPIIESKSNILSLNKIAYFSKIIILSPFSIICCPESQLKTIETFSHAISTRFLCDCNLRVHCRSRKGRYIERGKLFKNLIKAAAGTTTMTTPVGVRAKQQSRCWRDVNNMNVDVDSIKIFAWSTRQRRRRVGKKAVPGLDPSAPTLAPPLPPHQPPAFVIVTCGVCQRRHFVVCLFNPVCELHCVLGNTETREWWSGGWLGKINNYGIPVPLKLSKWVLAPDLFTSAASRKTHPKG